MIRDITVTMAQEYAESIVNTVREPLIVLDQDLRVVSASSSFYDVFKVRPEDTVGQLIYNLGNRQWDIPKLRELLETILPQKATFEDYEVEHDFASIGRRTMLLNARRIPIPPEKPKVILLAIEDITKRKQTEEALKVSEEQFKTMFREAPLGIALIDSMTGHFYEVNHMFARIAGRTLDQLANIDWMSITHPDDVQKDLANMALLNSGKIQGFHIEKRYLHPDGTVVWINMTVAPLKIEDKVQQRHLCMIEDITERKRLETVRKELEATKVSEDEAREYSESIINTVREPLIILDQDLRVVTVSRSFYEIFKVKPEETVGQLIYDLGNKQWNIPRLRELLETILPQKTTFDNYEVEHDFSTIGRRIMLLNARQIQRVLGKERIILLAIEDITERRKIENGLKKANDELEDLASELKRTARVKSEFLANMSHELRTPLNSINGFSEVLYDETFGPLNEKQKVYVNNVLTSGKHLLLLINQILDMAKLEAGKMSLSLSNLPMKSLLNEISLLVADMVSKKKLQMSIEIAEDLPNIEADELKVKEIIYNLLSNAVKFTPEGGEIGMKAQKTGSGIEIVVWDTGVGIADENMEKIFEGFFRVDTPYSRVTEGTGLGLPLSRKLVELHGGKLSVESRGLNKGTVVRFAMPIISGKVA